MLPTHLRLMCHHHTCTDEWCPTASALCPPSQSSPQKCAGGKSQLHSKRSLNEPSPEKFQSIGGFFECYTYRVMALGWQLKKEEEERKKEGKKERRKEFKEQFWLSTVSGLSLYNSYYALLLLLQTGAGSMSCCMYF